MRLWVWSDVLMVVRSQFRLNWSKRWIIFSPLLIFVSSFNWNVVLFLSFLSLEPSLVAVNLWMVSAICAVIVGTTTFQSLRVLSYLSFLEFWSYFIFLLLIVLNPLICWFRSNIPYACVLDTCAAPIVDCCYCQVSKDQKASSPSMIQQQQIWLSHGTLYRCKSCASSLHENLGSRQILDPWFGNHMDVHFTNMWKMFKEATLEAKRDLWVHRLNLDQEIWFLISV